LLPFHSRTVWARVPSFPISDWERSERQVADPAPKLSLGARGEILELQHRLSLLAFYEFPKKVLTLIVQKFPLFNSFIDHIRTKDEPRGKQIYTSPF